MPKKSLSLISAICLGILFPQISNLSFLIYYLLMFMLLFPFSDWSISYNTFLNRRVYFVLLANIVIGISGYLLLRDYDQKLALIIFLIGITPTATACPSVMLFLKGKVDFAISAVLITNLFMSLFLPFAIWKISNIHIEIFSILNRTLILILFPLILGQAIQHFLPEVRKQVAKFKNFGFYAWLLVCFIAVGKASSFIRSSSISPREIALIGSISAIVCLINFTLGKFLGGKNFALESSQTLGQKNTTLTIWIGLTYFGPYIALGPIFYLIWHNLYNSYQLAVLRNS